MDLARYAALVDTVEQILQTPIGGAPTPGAAEIGLSREGRSLESFRFGSGRHRISLIAGCHADEPIGSRFLRHLIAALATGTDLSPIPDDLEWWIVPHANPDGAARNEAWQRGDPDRYDPIEVLRGSIRELPGDDVEFGFPRRSGDGGARPENRAIANWWRTADGPFRMHASLHGMLVAAGPWFLLDRSWVPRTGSLRECCQRRVGELGYDLHDVERHGEKGFDRIERGFSTRPDSVSMRRHFLELGDANTAERFRPSSMETIRAAGGDPLTLVSEVPLFITPGVGQELGPPDPVALEWRERLERARARLATDPGAESELRHELDSAGFVAFPSSDALRIVGVFVLGAILTSIGTLD